MLIGDFSSLISYVVLDSISRLRVKNFDPNGLFFRKEEMLLYFYVKNIYIEQLAGVFHVEYVFIYRFRVTYFIF